MDMCPDRHRTVTDSTFITKHLQSVIYQECPDSKSVVSLQSNKMFTRALCTSRILFTLHTRPDITSHMSRTGSHVEGRITHRLKVESRRQPYSPHPHTNQHIKVSTLCNNHSSVFSKQIVSHQVRMFVRSGYGVFSVCGPVSRQTDTNPSRILPWSQNTCNL